MNTAEFQLASDAIRFLSDSRIRPGFHAIPATVTHRDFISIRRIPDYEIN
jgi:hypothetical protein